VIAPEILLQGYRLGVFPMAMEDGSIEWFSPDPRGVLPLDRFHAPHALARLLRKGVFQIRINTCFTEVMRRCAERDETWINGEIIASYTRLHHLGYAHSVETWKDDELVGGLYGVALGGAFFGESMFHEVTDASKVALAALVDRLRTKKFILLDTQWVTPHLARFGATRSRAANTCISSAAPWCCRATSLRIEPRVRPCSPAGILHSHAASAGARCASGAGAICAAE
jgi:leucyl/phenylalanyl-tRNA--protein transferase